MGWIKNLKHTAGCAECDCPATVCATCCPTPELVCETRSASKTKFAACGVLNSGTTWMVITETYADGSTRTTTYTQNPTTGACTLSVVCSGSWTVTYTISCSGTSEGDTYSCSLSETYTWTRAADCSTSSVLTSGTYSRTVQYSAEHGGDLVEDTGSVSGGAWSVQRKVNGSVQSTGNPLPAEPCPGCSVTTTNSPALITPSTSYSSAWTPETTASLISRTEGALPAWPGGWAGSGCSAYRNLSPDESSYSIREARFKFRLPAGVSLPAGKKLSITYRTTFTPEAGGSPTVTTATTEITSTESAIITVSVPGSDGTTSLERVSHECVPA